jgi:hypothetical protein
MRKDKAEVILLCRRDEDTEKALECFRGDGRVIGAECIQRIEAARFTDACLPENALRLVALDDLLFDCSRARQYLKMIGGMPRTATGILLHGEGLTRQSGEYWSLAAHLSRCAGLMIRGELEAGAVGLLDSAFRLVNAAWPEKSVGRVPEASFLVSGSVGADRLLRGQVWNRYLGGPKSYAGLDGLLFLLDRLCDELNFPQRYSIPRSLGPGKAADGLTDWPAYRLYVPDRLNISPAQQLVCIKVRFRASCSMQGELRGVGRGEKTGFCSADELAEKLMEIEKVSLYR